ncbi:MAG TPA: ribosome maturation factor RimM [Candidatus Dormibacteraeota bacterium]|jgi:16S rRNA processing protein RimM
MIRVGQVTGAFGLQGAVKVLPLTDFDDRFRPGSSLIVDGVTRHVEWSREQTNGLVIKLTGLDNRTLAELYRGRYLEVPVDAVHRLPEGEFYHHQLVGLAVVTASGAELGRLSEVLERPANDVWLARSGNVEHLVPATREAVLEVDLESGRVVVADWLLEVE